MYCQPLFGFAGDLGGAAGKDRARLLYTNVVKAECPLVLCWSFFSQLDRPSGSTSLDSFSYRRES